MSFTIFPAIDLRRSVSRVLPGVANAEENALIREARRMTAAYESVLPMLQAGLFKPGADPEADAAVRVHGALDAFLAAPAPQGAGDSFARLARALAGAAAAGPEGTDVVNG